jgi:hypothetical protein
MTGLDRQFRRLAALSRDDRRRILESLPVSSRQQLFEQLVATQAGDGQPAPGASAANGDDAASATLDLLEAAEPRQVAGVLSAEPDWVVGVALACREWSWGPDVVSTLHARAWPAAAPGPSGGASPAGRLARELITLLAARVETVPSVPEPPTTDLRSWLSARTRLSFLRGRRR